MVWKNRASVLEHSVGGDIPIACRTSVTLLITDESATARAMLAFLVHKDSIGCHRPFVIVPNRSRSEIEARSRIRPAQHSIATHDLRQAFQRALGGTVFIDEADRLSPTAQAWLFERLAIPRRTSIRGRLLCEDPATRVIAGCNHSLFDDVVAGRFDASLFYRLNVIQVNTLS